MIFASSLLAGLLLMQAAPAVETPPAQDSAAQTAPESAEPDDQTGPDAETEDTNDGAKIECRRQTIAGSRLASRKVCRTKAEWKIYEQDTQDSLNQATARHSNTAR